RLRCARLSCTFVPILGPDMSLPSLELSMTTTTSTLNATDREELVAARRDFHQHPELGFEEKRTATRVVEHLRALELPVRAGIAGTGVLDDIRGGRRGKAILLRADMDALPIQEENDVPYRSQTPGVMHACGHDCHMAMLLGAAKQLARDAAGVPGVVRLCFQPAEEIGRGAQTMIAEVGLADRRPDAALDRRVWQDLD